MDIFYQVPGAYLSVLRKILNVNMNIAIIGAGFAGLSTAKTLKAFGHTVTLFEKESDVGGVWSAARRYPGLTTQNVRSTYALSDFPYPDDYPEWPSGKQVQRYLEDYAQHFALYEHLRLNTVVTSTTLEKASGRWAVTSIYAGTSTTETFDYLVVCNGIFSQPAVPEFAGAEAFIDQGGRILHSSEFHDVEAAKGKNVLIVGYGKSACDIAEAVCSVASSTVVVARQLIWKVPKKLLNILNYKYLLLTRLGEGLFKYRTLRGVEKFLHGAGQPLRNAMLAQVQWVVTQQCRLKQLDLLPEEPFEAIARSTVSLSTDGFYKSVASGNIKVKRDTAISKIVQVEKQSFVELDTGELLPADMIICGTGWTQSVPFFSKSLNKKIVDARGNFRLYRLMIPVGIPNLAFNGYHSSLFSQLNCEMGALWIASLINQSIQLPTKARQNEAIDQRLNWMEQFTAGKHAKGTNIIPFSLHHVDELLADMHISLSPLVRLKQWLLPIDPGDFASVTQRLLEKQER